MILGFSILKIKNNQLALRSAALGGKQGVRNSLLGCCHPLDALLWKGASPAASQPCCFYRPTLWLLISNFKAVPFFDDINKTSSSSLSII